MNKLQLIKGFLNDGPIIVEHRYSTITFSDGERRVVILSNKYLSEKEMGTSLLSKLDDPNIIHLKTLPAGIETKSPNVWTNISSSDGFVYIHGHKIPCYHWKSVEFPIQNKRLISLVKDIRRVKKLDFNPEGIIISQNYYRLFDYNSYIGVYHEW